VFLILLFGTAIVLFVPVSAWIVHDCFGADRLSYKALALISMVCSSTSS
jgi:hypothetical protein